MDFSRKAKHSVSTLGQRIRMARHWAGLSQTKLARRAEVTASAVAQWEHPEGTRPSLQRLEVIARATHVPIEWLIAGGTWTPKSVPTEAKQDTPAVVFDVYAETLQEEALLRDFRLLSAKARDHLVALVHESTSHRRKPRIKRS